MLTSVVTFPTVHSASRDDGVDMRLAPGRRAGSAAWARSFGEGTRVKGTFDAGAVTMDMALHSAFPASAMAYGYSVDSPTMVEEAWEGCEEVGRGASIGCANLTWSLEGATGSSGKMLLDGTSYAISSVVASTASCSGCVMTGNSSLALPALGPEIPRSRP